MRGKAYQAARLLALAVMLASHAILALQVAIAQASGGYLVILVDKYHEGLAEAALLLLTLPLSALVAAEEAEKSLRSLLEGKKGAR